MPPGLFWFAFYCQYKRFDVAAVDFLRIKSFDLISTDRIVRITYNMYNINMYYTTRVSISEYKTKQKKTKINTTNTRLDNNTKSAIEIKLKFRP